MFHSRRLGSWVQTCRTAQMFEEEELHVPKFSMKHVKKVWWLHLFSWFQSRLTVSRVKVHRGSIPETPVLQSMAFWRLITRQNVTNNLCLRCEETSGPWPFPDLKAGDHVFVISPSVPSDLDSRNDRKSSPIKWRLLTGSSSSLLLMWLKVLMLWVESSAEPEPPQVLVSQLRSGKSLRLVKTAPPWNFDLLLFHTGVFMQL